MTPPSFSKPAWGVDLFTQGDTAYEFFMDLGPGRLGERILLARPRTPRGYKGCVVLKCLPTPLGADASGRFQRARARLEEEARLAKYLQHPRIARVHGLVELEQGLCVMMERVEGLTLNTLLSVAQVRGRYFSESFILYVGAETAAALAHAHTRTDEAGVPLGIVNRDIHPGRIRLGPRGEVWLTDFGLALSRLTGRVATSFPRAQGEVLYAAPEALRGEAVDASSDLFSLGLTLLEFATGRHLYDPGHLLAEQVEAQLSQEEREKVLAASVASLDLELPSFAEDALRCAMAFRSEDVEHAARGLSVPLRDILHTLLRHDPAERFATAAELERVLRARLAQLEPYAEQEALREVQQALADVGDDAWDIEVPGDEGGISPPLTEEQAREPLQFEVRPRYKPRRPPDEVTTAPGDKTQHAVRRTPTV
ncbi:MAG: serine/threonine protein kinase [Myxococcaceae bacterium]|nr:MAG: serine/threonine protein kinase [Myxococcaceae bacterium]